MICHLHPRPRLRGLYQYIGSFSEDNSEMTARRHVFKDAALVVRLRGLARCHVAGSACALLMSSCVLRPAFAWVPKLLHHTHVSVVPKRTRSANMPSHAIIQSRAMPATVSLTILSVVP